MAKGYNVKIGKIGNTGRMDKIGYLGGLGGVRSLSVLGYLSRWQSRIVHSQQKSAVRRFFLKFRVDFGR